MTRRSILFHFGIAMLLIASTVFGQSPQQKQIADEIARLGSSSEPERSASVKVLVEIGKPAAPALVKALSDPHNEVRAYAAEALRSILAVDPANAPNYHEKEFWKQRVAQLKARMPLDEALKVLLPDLSPAERLKRCGQGPWSGNSGVSGCRLDDYWAVNLYLIDYGKEKLHEHAPELSRVLRQAWIDPPDKYTGGWVTWYVNGRKALEIQYSNGQRDGTLTGFFDNGSMSTQQHILKGVSHGTDTGWHRNGQKAYEGQYENGKQVGMWRWWKENGHETSTQEYIDGKLLSPIGK